MKRVFLVDDEALALRRLARMLAATRRVEIVGQATDPEEALVQIAARPDLDLVFLDIAMPTLDGFEVCARLPETVMVVFTTAYDEHALRAFQTNAIDYLLKPIAEAGLARALDKLDRLRELSRPEANAQHAAAIARAVTLAPRRIASRLGGRIQLVELDRITHFHAEDKLTHAHTADRSYIVDATIAELEDRHRDFVRVHRSLLVRTAAIAELYAGDDGMKIRLRDGRSLPVARERTKALKAHLGL
jgi:two-component system LytT family response regulator